MALSAAPLLASAMRAQDLPDDAFRLIRIAAGDDATLRDAVAETGAGAERVREAAALYVEHVVFAPNADHYRILGAAPDASHAVLREHVGWLMKWLHPDRVAKEWESVFAQRVLAAWNDLKTPAKRTAYDAMLPQRPAERRTPSGKRRALQLAPRRVPLIAAGPRVFAPLRLARVAFYVMAGVVAVVMALAPDLVSAPSVDDPAALASSDTR